MIPGEPPLDDLQRRTVRSLVGIQMVGALGVTVGIATASLLARDLSGSDSVAGLSQTGQVLGTALAAWAIGRTMNQRGRRPGLVLGYLVAATGAFGAVLAGTTGSIALLLVSMVLLGAASASNNAARYAATDLADDRTRGRALSVVVWATTVGAVAGPNLSGPAGSLAEAVGVPVLTGPFLVGGIGLLAAAGLTAWRLRPDPLVTARLRAEARTVRSLEGGPTPGAPRSRTSWGRVLQTLKARPVLGSAAVALAAGHATMVAVMVMTPLHMEHGGAGLEVIGVVISLHVLGMYAFAPAVGWAVDRFGAGRVLVTGGGVLAISLVVSGSSHQGSSPQIMAGLLLLGLGWSIATVSASTVLAALTPLDVRADVQGATDMAMALAAAAASAFAGVLVGAFGYPALAAYAAVPACLVVAAGFSVVRRGHAEPHVA